MVFESIKNAATELKAAVPPVNIDGTQSGTPLLLLPLRTEVKFVDDMLLVRVYPENISIEQHETKLTESEKRAGERYWKILNDTPGAADAVWAAVSNTFGAQRSEWIIQETRPTNWENRRPGNSLIYPQKTTKKSSWSEPAICRVLPEYLHVCVKPDKGRMIQLSGNTIPDKLQVGPDPKKMTSGNANGREFDLGKSEEEREDFNLGGEIAWMTDFEAAVNNGMGFRINLPAGTKSIEWLFVFGVKTFKNDNSRPEASQKGQAAIARLFQAHYYTPDGLSLMPQGAPTKNTEQKSTAHAKPLGFEREHYQRSINPAATTSAANPRKSDQQLLAEALGINFHAAQAGEIQKLAPYHNDNDPGAYDYQEAVAMNTALFPATLGYFTEMVLGKPFGDEQAAFRDWFIQYVTGRGTLPAIKIGNQPYGILPATYFPDLARHDDFPIFQAIAQETDEKLQVLMSDVTDISSSGKDMGDKLADILYQHPASVRHWVRLAFLRINRAYSPPEVSGGNPVYVGPNGEQIHAGTGSAFFEESFMEGINDKKPPFDQLPATDFGFQFTPESLIKTPLVTSRVLSEEERLPTEESIPLLNGSGKSNYIEWIKTNFVYTLANHLREAQHISTAVFPEGFGKNTLLSRFLMHALLQQIHKCAYYWLRDQSDYIQFETDGIRMRDIFDPNNPEKYIYELKRRWPFKNSEDENDKNITIPLDILFAPLGEVFTHTDKDGNPNFAIDRFNFIYKNSECYNYPDFKVAYDRVTVAEHIHYLGGEVLFGVISDELVKELKFLDQLKSSLDTLAQMPTARLERCLVEHFDVLSYRMDAWRSAFCLEKLKNDRGLTSFMADAGENPQGGLHLGAYGCLLNIKRDTAKIPVDVEAPAMKAFDLDKALEWISGSGFVHGPSLDQATAGAVLKSAHTRFKHLYPKNPEMFAVNLSSARVRQGLYLLEGIQQGQYLGVLLGYQFEREMHDAGLDRHILDLRRAYPHLPGKLKQLGYADNGGTENLNMAGVWPVIDGLAVLEAKESITLPTEEKESNKKRVKDIIENLKNSLDALKDLLIAESIYQYTQNKIDRASAVLESVSNMEVPPALEFIKTPRHPAHTTLHRVAVLFDNAHDAGFDHTDHFNSPGSWAQLTLTARAIAEPKLNHWLGNILGNPDEIVCWVCRRDEANADLDGQFIKVSDLGVQPLDLVYLSGQIVPAPETLAGNPPLHHAGASEIEQRIVAAYYQRQKGKKTLLSGYQIYINFNKPDQVNRTFAQCLPLLKYLHDIVENARPMKALDFETGTTPYPNDINYNNYNVARSGPTITDVGNMMERLHKLSDALHDLKKSMDKIVAGRQDVPDIAQQLQQFQLAAGFGIPDAVIQIPVEPVNETAFQEYLKSRADVVGKEVKARIDQIIQFEGDFSFSTQVANADKRINYFERKIEDFYLLIKTIFNGTVKVLPVFMLGHNSAHELGYPKLEKRTNIDAALKKQDALLERAKEKGKTSSNQIVLEEWLSAAAEVRPNLHVLEMAKLLYESVDASNNMPLQLIQMTSGDDEVGYEYDTWLGGPIEAGKKINTNKAGVVAIYPYRNAVLPYEGGFSGLIVDEWTELIPQAKERTAIAINHDQPLSRPPQALMLAVSSNSDRQKPWTIEEVGSTVMYAFTRAMMRGISPDKIMQKNKHLGRLLPALYGEYMQDGRNMSLDLLHN